jgi:copper chaperone CopZ
VTKALEQMTGVRTVHVELESKRVTVQFDAAQVSPGKLADQLTEVGWDATVAS